LSLNWVKPPKKAHSMWMYLLDLSKWTWILMLLTSMLSS
jgi:hypothetical protein